MRCSLAVAFSLVGCFVPPKPSSTPGPARDGHSGWLHGLVGAGNYVCVLRGSSPICWGGSSYNTVDVEPRQLRPAAIERIRLGRSGILCLVANAESQCLGWKLHDEHIASLEKQAQTASASGGASRAEPFHHQIDDLQRRLVGVPVPDAFTDVAFSDDNVYLIGRDGTLTVQDYATPPTSTPFAGAKVSEVRTTSQHVCALQQDRRVRCWIEPGYAGRSSWASDDQVTSSRKGDTRFAFPGAVISRLSDARGLAITRNIGCARDSLNRVTCWRHADLPLQDSRFITYQLSAQAEQLVAGEGHLCGLNHGRVWCLGDNDYGQLGNRTTESSSVPVVASELEGAREIAVTDGATCVLVGEEVRCVGTGADGAFGHPVDLLDPAPIRVPDEDSLHVVHGRTCLSRGGYLNCTDGTRSGGLVERARFGRSLTLGGFGLGAYRADQRASCLLTRAGDLSCQAGDRSWRLTGVADVQVEGAICARMVDGTAQCWRYNRSPGLRGVNPIEANDSPTPVAGAENLIALSMNVNRACGVRRDGQVMCWGWNMSGGLGDGTREPRDTAVFATGLDEAVEIVQDNRYVCVRRRDGGVRCLDTDIVGQGTNKFLHDLPVKNAQAMARSPNGPCVLSAGGGVTCGYFGVPAREVVRGATSLVGGGTHACARLANGDARCWGYGDSGALGPSPPWLHLRATSIRLPLPNTSDASQ